MRQRFLSEHLNILTEGEEELPDLEPESPPIKHLQLDNKLQMEELNLSANEDVLSRNTDFAIHFSTTEDEDSAHRSTARLFSTLEKLKYEGKGPLILQKKKSRSVHHFKKNSIFDILQNIIH